MKKLIFIAVLGLLTALFFSPLHAQYSGPSGGVIGIVVDSTGPEVVIRRVMRGSGAARAGVKEGDVITAINRVPVTKCTMEAFNRKLRGGVGSEVTLTLKGPDGMPRDVSIIREAVAGLGEAILPINIGLPKPHDLRPEDGMVCTIAGASGSIATINCGKDAGVDRGQSVRFVNRSDYAKHSSIATGTVAKVDTYTSKVSVSGASKLACDDVVAITSAWRSERARENTLWRVTAYGINLIDYPTGLPYATIGQLRFDTELELEQAAVRKMAERLRASSDIARRIEKGKSVASAFSSTNPKDVMAFLNYLKTYPDKFVGRDWYLPEVYATWILNGSPQ
jgi:hypothetical protein